MWDAIGKILFSKHRDLFVVNLGSSLLLLKLGVPPTTIAGKVIGFLIKGFLGFFVDSGVFLIDVTLDSLREGAKLEEFKREAKAAYDKATAKVYDEAEKQKIRRQYLEIISRIGTVGDGPK